MTLKINLKKNESQDVVCCRCTNYIYNAPPQQKKKKKDVQPWNDLMTLSECVDEYEIAIHETKKKDLKLTYGTR